ARRDDHIVGAGGEVKEAVPVVNEGVAGEIPAVAHVAGLAFWGEVAAAGRAAYRELADLAARLLLHILVDDLGLVADHRSSGAGGRRIAEPGGDEEVQHLR